MAGKAYTMREMRAIVDYLKERKAYGELKGRKMWMEFANSDKTTRTWQSLKETFIKRILPDIQNPYYMLTMDQVRSFKQGCDVTENEKNNRLEFRAANNVTNEIQNGLETANKDNEVPTTSLNSEIQIIKDNDLATTSLDEALEKATGEGITAAKIPSRCRSSTETLVLEYENAEDIQRDLESPKSNENEKKTKSLKDKYSAPLTPLVRDLLEDFETESEASDKEAQLKIVEDHPKNDKDSDAVAEVLEDIKVENMQLENESVNNEADSTMEINDSENAVATEINHEKVNSVPEETLQIDNNKSYKPHHDDDELVELNYKSKETMNQSSEDTNAHKLLEQINSNKITYVESTTKDTTEFVTAECNSKTFDKLTDATKNKNYNNTIPNTGNSTQNTSSDTLLPNNQEALGNSKKKTQKTEEKTLEKEEIAKKPKKRAASKDSIESKEYKSSDDKPKEINSDETAIPVIEIDDTSSEQNTASIIQKNTTVSTPTDEINTFNSTTNTEQNNTKKISGLESVPKKADKPKTSTEKENPNNIINKDKHKIPFVEKNPCLMSVSLYEEQFNNTIYSDSDDPNDVTPAPKQKQNTDKTQAVTDKPQDAADKPQLSTDNPQVVSVKPRAEANKPRAATEKFQASTDKPKAVMDKPYNKDKRNVQDNTKNIQDEKRDTQDRLDKPQQEENEHGKAEKTKVAEKILLLSSDNELENRRVISHDSRANTAVSSQREKALANVFGFAHGGVASTSRKRRLSQRRKSYHPLGQSCSKNIASSSSEWTSESDNESYISPPRTRKNRITRKYLKPKSSRVLQDPEEGMLYVVLGKHVYPLVKDGKHIKNYLTYMPESDSDEEESYWRQKYVEKKQKLAEIRKLLKESQVVQEVRRNELSTPERPSKSKQHGTSSYSPKKPVQSNIKELVAEPEVERKPDPKDDKMVLKIAAKNGLEYCLEGGWKQISSAMPEVVRMMQGDTKSSNGKSKPVTNATLQLAARDVEQSSKVDSMEVSSETSTPVQAAAVAEPDVLEKVNKIESEIFNEIKALEMEDEVKQTNEESTTNITKRKLRHRNVSDGSSVVIVSKSPAKRARSSKTDPTDSIQESKPAKGKRVSKTKINIPEQRDPKTAELVTVTQQNEIAKESTPKIVEKLDTEKNINVKEKRQQSRSVTRLSKQRETSEAKSTTDIIASVGTRASARQLNTPNKYDTGSPASEVKLRAVKSAPTREISILDLDDENVRFKLPPNEAPKNNKKPPTTGKNYRSLPEINIVPPQETLGHSIDSTQGYQDSDISPLKICLPIRKRKASFATRKSNKTRRSTRRKSFPMLLQEQDDSSNSSYFVPLRKSLSSLNSEVRSEPFQLLMERKTYSSSYLEPIDENPPVCEIASEIRHFNSVSKDSIKSDNDNSQLRVELGSSSNVSLPLSPGLSVVENLSISREIINSVNHPTINEAQQNKSDHLMDYSDFMISNLDVSVPLMNQNCDLQQITKKANSANSSNKLDNMQLKAKLKDCTVNLTSCETLEQRLHDLLLESAKKTRRVDNKVTPMEVDQTPVVAKKTRARNRKINVEIDVEQSETDTKKTMVKKRSSTPRKKKTTAKAKGPQQPMIEEEHMQSCSYSGRNSCPPVISFMPLDENANNCSDVILPAKTKVKKKKDIIRVKIQRPKDKSQPRYKSAGNASAVSTCTDSGIIDTETISGVLLKDSEDSVDLIHNHSETCLLANECIEDSVEFVANSPISVITLSSSRDAEDSAFFRMLQNEVCLSEVTSNNQENVSNELETPEIYGTPENFETADAAYPISPVISNCSLITEDLSVSPPTQEQPSKWYLLEEDVSNAESFSTTVASFGSNLAQIFPITCAVPNLSSISEMSKENEDSQKKRFDTPN